MVLLLLPPFSAGLSLVHAQHALQTAAHAGRPSRHAIFCSIRAGGTAGPLLLTVFSDAMLAVPPALMLTFKHLLEGVLVRQGF